MAGAAYPRAPMSKSMRRSLAVSKSTTKVVRRASKLTNAVFSVFLEEKGDELLQESAMVMDIRGFNNLVRYELQDTVGRFKLRMEEAGLGKVEEMHLQRVDDDDDSDASHYVTQELRDDQRVASLKTARALQLRLLVKVGVLFFPLAARQLTGCDSVTLYFHTADADTISLLSLLAVRFPKLTPILGSCLLSSSKSSKPSSTEYYGTKLTQMIATKPSREREQAVLDVVMREVRNLYKAVGVAYKGNESTPISPPEPDYVQRLKQSLGRQPTDSELRAEREQVLIDELKEWLHREPDIDELSKARARRTARELDYMRVRTGIAGFQEELLKATDVSLPPHIPYEVMTPQQISEALLDAVLSEAKYLSEGDQFQLHYIPPTSEDPTPAGPMKTTSATPSLLRVLDKPGWTVPDVLKAIAVPPIAILSSRSGHTYDAAVEMLRGPSTGTSWLLRGRVLCGDAPLDSQQLSSLLDAGVDTFVDLRHALELEGGGAYRYRAEELAQQRNASLTFAALSTPAELNPGDIADLGVAEDKDVAQLVLDIIALAASGKVIYVHCSTGFQRTAVVGALLLGIVHSLSASHALLLYQAVHDTRVRSSGQEAFISKRWPLGNSLEGKRGAIEAVQSKPDSLGCPVFFPPQRAQVIRLLSTQGNIGPSERQLVAKETFGKEYDGCIIL